MMYRSSCYFVKPSILNSRCRFVSSKTRNIVQNDILKKHRGRLISSTSGTKSLKNKLYWGLSFVTISAGGASLFVLSKNYDEFREAVEDAIPLSKFAFNALIPVKEEHSILVVTDSEEENLEGGISLTPLHTDTVLETFESVDQINPTEDTDSRLVVNVMDSPYVSQIDLQVGNQKPSVQMEDPGAEGVSPIEGDRLVVNVMDSPYVSQIDFEVGNPVVEEAVIEAVVEEAVVEEAVVEEAVVEEAVSQVLSQEVLEEDLGNLRDNLEIILNDAITSKKVAANSLQSYLIQFGQALLVPKSDPSYEPICEATLLLEQEVQENIDLAKSKESEVDNQIKRVVNLISVIRKSGFSDAADKVEEFIVNCHESLTVGDSETESASDKLNLLLSFQRRVQGSTEGSQLHEYLENFTPNLVSLLNSQQSVDVQGVSNEDALLMLSLQKSKLISEEGHKKQVEMEKQLQESLLLQKEELNELHMNNLSKQQATLSEQHKEELERKLAEQEDAHHFVLESNMSYLKGIESKITDVADLDHQQRRNQHLWVATQALNSALDNCSVNGRTKSLTTELSTILQYGKDDAILENIVASVSDTAATMGVVPESDLLERFKSVKRVCKRVANVEEGGSILSYTLSYIKSFFVMSWYYRRNPEEDINIDNIIPYEILEKADYFIEKRDLVQAAKLMSQLQGVSRKMSSDWLNEVRLLLETKQMAKFLMAYAGSLIAGFE